MTLIILDLQKAKLSALLDCIARPWIQHFSCFTYRSYRVHVSVSIFNAHARPSIHRAHCTLHRKANAQLIRAFKSLNWLTILSTLSETLTWSLQSHQRKQSPDHSELHLQLSHLIGKIIDLSTTRRLEHLLLNACF